MNKVILLGRLTRDPELKTTGTGRHTASFSLAVNRPYAKGDDKKADFFNIVTWNKTAEFVCSYFKKGSQIALVGRLQERSHEDKDGVKKFVVEVIADEVFFAGKTNRTDAAPVGEYVQGEFIAKEDDDLPF